MDIARLGYTQSFLVVGAGMFTGYQAKIIDKLIRRRETLEIADFRKNAHGCCTLNAQKACQPIDRFLIAFPMRKLLDSLVVSIYFLHQTFYFSQVTVKHLLINIDKLQLFKPFHVLLCPFAFCGAVHQAVSEAKR